MDLALISTIISIGGPLAERLLPPIMAALNGLNHPDLDKPLREFISDIDFVGELERIRKARAEAEKKVGIS